MKVFKASHLCILSTFLIAGCSSSKKEPLADGMRLIPAGAFNMGARDSQAYRNEFPSHKVSVSAFLMDETEVTNAQFKKFAEATGYRTTAERDVDWEEMKKQLPENTPRPPDSVLAAGSLIFHQTVGPVDLRDYSQWWVWKTGANWRQPEGPGSSIEDRMDHPVVHVSWDDAAAYAEWVGKRLPTEAEWEWASMGGQSGVYPWGNDPIDQAYDKANFWQGIFPFKNLRLDGYENTSPAKSFPPNGYGLYDMAGNVWEWTSDRYNETTYMNYKNKGPIENPEGADEYFDPAEPYAQKHVVRGGSFLCNESYCSGYRVSRRMGSSRDTGLCHTGFRCAKDL